MRFGILGEAAAWGADGSVIQLPRAKLRALLSLLVLEPGHVVSTDRLAEGVYGREPPANTANALQAHVSRLRRQLGAGSDLVEHRGDGYRLAIEPESTDTYQFHAKSSSGQQALASGDPEDAARQLQAALDLWRGPALADLADSSLVRERIVGLEEQRLAASESLAQADIARGMASATIARLRELVAAHPLRERLWSLLVRALADAGRRAEALNAFEEARAMLADELGADPSAELAAAHLDVLRAEVEPVSGPRVRQPPVPLTKLVGRREELERLDALMAGARLVTLTGVGGVGKTRLAIAAAERTSMEVCFVDLASATDPAEVPATVGIAMGLRTDTASDETSEQLANVLAHRPVLLLLDNCEHLADSVASLTSRLLSDCPTTRILATSREPLGITGESLCPVPALELPPEDATPDTAQQHSAVSLFVERAVMGDPDFAFDTDNCEHVLAICRTLDGIPLAIELAAARARTLPLAQVASRLDEPFTVFSQGDPTKTGRHRTLQAVIDWSWSLLNDAEQDMAGRFSVFTGSATLAAVREVCNLAETEDLLGALVDKSLVQLREGRYRMLNTVRAFAAERLAESDATDRYRHRHAQYYLDVARQADPHLRSSVQLHWLDQMDVAYPNLRAALQWAISVDAKTALRLASALAMYWWLRGRRHEGARLNSAVVDAVGTQPPPELAEEYLLAVFTAAVDSSTPEPLRTHLDTVNRLAQKWSRPPEHVPSGLSTPPPCQPMLAIMWARLSGPTPDAGRALVAPAVELLDSDPWGHALHALSDGLQQLHTGQARAAEHSFTTALIRFREIGERWGTMKTLVELSGFASWRGEHDTAVAQLDEAIALSCQLAATEDTAELRARRAECMLRAGELAPARVVAVRALELAQDTGVPEHVARARAVVADIDRRAGNTESAEATARQALTECGSGWVRASEARMRVLLVLGNIAARAGRTDEALASHLEVVSDGDAVTAAVAIEGLAVLAVTRCEGRRAAWMLGAAAQLRGAPLITDPEVSETTRNARALVGTKTFDAAYGATSGMSRTDVLDRTAAEWSTTGR